jgi:SAM-dependent methyltransferase
MRTLAAALSAHYQGDAGLRYRNTHLGVADDEVYAAIARQRARKLAPFVGTKDSVFEYGVGTGFNLAELQCRERVGYDLFDSAAELAARGIRFCYHTALLRTGRFDVALCMHTLEHVASPWEALLEIKRVIKRDGRLVLCVPFEVGPSYRRFDPRNIHQHVYSWNPQSLGMLLTKVGFELEVLEIRRFGYDRFTASILRGSRNDTLYRLVHWALLRIRPHYEIVAVCRKP